MRVLVTGGPTRAYLDRVRFISNFSSGELAFRICQKLCESRAEVIAVVGPTSQPFSSLPLFRLFSVETNEQMSKFVHYACRKFRPEFGVFAAAVLDFVPQTGGRKGKTSSKLRRWRITLKPAPKIIDQVGLKFPSLRKVGFKLEWKKASSKDRKVMAQRNMRDKGLEVLCLNYLSEIREGRHPAYIYTRDGESLKASNKSEIADRIKDCILSRRAPGLSF